MRKITKESVSSFLDKSSFHERNMIVRVDPNEVLLQLHGNPIAKIDDDDNLWITTSGWFTNTTCDRLRALPNVDIEVVNGKWFLNGKRWDGDWVKVGKI